MLMMNTKITLLNFMTVVCMVTLHCQTVLKMVKVVIVIKVRQNVDSLRHSPNIKEEDML